MQKSIKWLAVCLPIFLCQCADTTPGEIVVKKSEFKGKWPFPSAEAAAISCVPGTMSVLVKLNGKTYGLNGDAIGRGRYPDSRVEMGKDEYGGYQLGDYDVLIQQGLVLCDK